MARRNTTSECVKRNINNDLNVELNDRISKLADKCSIFSWSSEVYNVCRNYLAQEQERHCIMRGGKPNDDNLIYGSSFDDKTKSAYFIMKNSDARPYRTDISNMMSFHVKCSTKDLLLHGDFSRVSSGITILNGDLYLADYRNYIVSDLNYKYIKYSLDDLEHVIFVIRDAFSFEIFIKGLYRIIDRYMISTKSNFEEAFFINAIAPIDELMHRMVSSLEIDVSLKFKNTFGYITLENILDYETGDVESKLHFLRYLLDPLCVSPGNEPESDDMVSPWVLHSLFYRRSQHESMRKTIEMLWRYQRDFQDVFSLMKKVKEENNVSDNR